MATHLDVAKTLLDMTDWSDRLGSDEIYSIKECAARLKSIPYTPQFLAENSLEDLLTYLHTSRTEGVDGIMLNINDISILVEHLQDVEESLEAYRSM